MTAERAGNELSGEVRGSAVQAGVVHGDVYLHADGARREAPPVPRQMPPASPHFTNRAEELDWLDDAMNDATCALAVLSGPGGVGKTALTVHWTHRVSRHFPDGQLYVDLQGFGGEEPVDPGEALGGFLRALGVARGRIAVSTAEQSALFRSLVAGRSFLVVLDNAYSAAQVRPLLPATPASLAVVTSRSRLVGLLPDGARLLEVGPLPARDSVALLTRAVGAARIGRERALAERLVGMCGGLPIALSVIAARLASRPRLSVGRVAAELADEAGRLGVLSTPGGSSVQAAFDVSYQSLEPGAAALYRVLSLHPGPEFGAGPVAAVLPVIRRRTPDDLHDRTVELLIEANMLQEVEEDRFRFHDLLRLHARQRTEREEPAEVRDRATLAILEWYLAAADRAGAVLTPYRQRLPYRYLTEPPAAPAPAGRNEALDWFERERTNLISAGNAALAGGAAELAWHLSDVMWPLFLYRKHYRSRLDADETGVRAARQWGNAWAEAHMLKRYGRIRAVLGDHADAERHTLLAIEISEKIGDTRGAMEARENLAALFRDLGRLRAAADLYGQVLAASRATGEPRRIGLSLINLGRMLPELGRPDAAITLLREAEALFDALSDVDPYNAVRVTIGLAGAYLGAGDLDRAGNAAAEAARRMRDLGSDAERAEALDLMGRVDERRGDRSAARRHWLAALGILERLGSTRAVELRRRLDDLGTPPSGTQPESGRARQ